MRWIPRVRAGGGAAGPRRRCQRCGYLLLADQRRCSECGFEPAPPSPGKRLAPPQLAVLGPAVVKPIALRFTVMALVALLGPLLAVVQSVLIPLAGLAAPPGLDRILATLAAPLPISIVLALPAGRGALGGDRSAIPIDWPRPGGVSLHRVTAILSLAWWVAAVVLLLPFSSPFVTAVLVGAFLAASAGSFLHLSWLAALGESVADDGPRRLHEWCLGVGLLVAIVAVAVAIFDSSMRAIQLGLFIIFLTALVAQIVGPSLLARDMFFTLIGSYEELGRAERRAQRAREHEPRLPS